MSVGAQIAQVIDALQGRVVVLEEVLRLTDAWMGHLSRDTPMAEDCMTGHPLSFREWCGCDVHGAVSSCKEGCGIALELAAVRKLAGLEQRPSAMDREPEALPPKQEEQDQQQEGVPNRVESGTTATDRPGPIEAKDKPENPENPEQQTDTHGTPPTRTVPTDEAAQTHPMSDERFHELEVHVARYEEEASRFWEADQAKVMRELLEEVRRLR